MANALQMECTVCQGTETVQSGTLCLPCGHAFHLTCVAGWLKHHETCPNCRASYLTHNLRTCLRAVSEASSPAQEERRELQPDEVAVRRAELLNQCGLAYAQNLYELDRFRSVAAILRPHPHLHWPCVRLAWWCLRHDDVRLLQLALNASGTREFPFQQLVWCSARMHLWKVCATLVLHMRAHGVRMEKKTARRVRRACRSIKPTTERDQVSVLDCLVEEELPKRPMWNMAFVAGLVVFTAGVALGARLVQRR